MNRMFRFSVLTVALLAAACSTGRDGRRMRGPNVPIRADLMERNSEIAMIERFDTNHDGTITRAEADAVLKADFAAADANKNSFLDAQELAAENDRRWKQSGSAASPAIDWNQDGSVDLQEFSATGSALFAQLDRDQNGVLDQEELKRRDLPRNMPPTRTRQRAGGN